MFIRLTDLNLINKFKSYKDSYIILYKINDYIYFII